MMPRLTVDIVISADEYLKRYSQRNTVVSTVTLEGKSIRFPAGILQPFVLHNGISGRFSIEFDENNKFVGIHRLS